MSEKISAEMETELFSCTSIKSDPTFIRQKSEHSPVVSHVKCQKREELGYGGECASDWSLFTR